MLHALRYVHTPDKKKSHNLLEIKGYKCFSNFLINWYKTKKSFKKTSKSSRSLCGRRPASQQDAGPLVDGGLRVEVGPYSLHKHVLNAVLVQGRTLQVAQGLDLACQASSLTVANGCLVLLLQLLHQLLVVSEVTLCAHQEDGNARTVVGHLVMTPRGEKCLKNLLQMMNEKKQLSYLLPSKWRQSSLP